MEMTDKTRAAILEDYRRRTGFAAALGVLAVAFLAGFGAGPANAAPCPPPGASCVTRIVDGDTVVVTKPDGRTTTVRVLAIDTPETKHPSKPVECWGPEATKFARDTLLGQPVNVVADPSQDGTDRYGRILAEVVRADGWNYSVEAARAGAAESYVYSVRRPARVTVAVQVAEREAQAAGRGMWGPPCYGER